jgi:DNA-directed RNA polymerase specialized sigma24 family protein
MSVYNVTVEREGKFWLVRAEGVTGLTQARRFGEVELMAREYISLVQDEELESVTIGSVSVAGVSDQIAKAAAEREHARELESTATARVRTAVARLRAESVPLTEIGQILGVSHQRAHQLVKA